MAELAESVGPHVVYSILAKRTSSFNDTKNEVEIKNNTEVWAQVRTWGWSIQSERARKNERETRESARVK